MKRRAWIFGIAAILVASVAVTGVAVAAKRPFKSGTYTATTKAGDKVRLVTNASGSSVRASVRCADDAAADARPTKARVNRETGKFTVQFLNNGVELGYLDGRLRKSRVTGKFGGAVCFAPSAGKKFAGKRKMPKR